MTLYEALVLVHVVMAVAWVGGVFLMNVLATRAVRSHAPERAAGYAAELEWVILRVFTPAALLVLASGIWAASEGNWEFGEPWVSMGFAGWMASFFAGLGFFRPEAGRIARLVAAEGPASGRVLARIGRLLLLSRLELVVLVVVIWAMVAKPGL
jgi:uncharacterized membrane protein